MEFLKAFGIIGSFLSWLFGKLKKDPVKVAYKKVAEAERGEAVAQEEVIEVRGERQAEENRDKPFDGFFEEEEY